MPLFNHKIICLTWTFVLFSTALCAQLKETISFSNAEDATVLKGTLECAQDTFEQVVILVPGAGEDDRTNNAMLADSLLAAGYAVFRYDDRGVGKSSGKFSKATTLDFARDLQAALNHFRSSASYAQKQLLVVGFGEGGLMALLAADAGPAPDRMVLISTPAMRCDFIIFAQTENQLRERWELGNSNPRDTRSHMIKINTILRKDLPEKEMRKEVQQYLKDNDLPKVTARFTNPHYRYYIDLDPTEILRTLRIPMHFLYGEADLFVQPQQNTNKIWKTGNPYITYETVTGLEHYLQPAGAAPEAMDPRGIRRILRYFNEPAP